MGIVHNRGLIYAKRAKLTKNVVGHNKRQQFLSFYIPFPVDFYYQINRPL